MNEEEKKWTIEGLTELRKIMSRSMIKGIDIYIESPLNFKKALDNALELIEKQQKEIESRLKEIDSLYKMMSAKDDEIEELKTITRGYEAYECEVGDKIIIADKNFFGSGIFIKKFVSLEEYNLLLKRFRHLIKSKIISSYDETKKGKYCKDISKFDTDYISKDKIRKLIKEKAKTDSVSTLFRDKVGKNMALGFEEGFTEKDIEELLGD